VDSGRVATAGGLTSGIDMALHIVQRYFGAEVADTTARYMEYERASKSNS
jgi:transcriptional regulator GlxA family with amidase domain